LESVAPPDSTRTFNRDSRILLTFTTEIDTIGLAPWVAIGPDTVGFARRWVDSRTVELRPRSEPVPDGWYDLRHRAGSLRSWTDVAGPAEDAYLSWQGSRPPGRGWLRITVNADSVMSAGIFHIIIEGSGSATEERTVVTADGPGEVQTPLLPEGPYLIWGFADANGNGRLDAGRIRPFEAAERVDSVPDTQYVRDTFEGIVSPPLELGGIRRMTPIPAAADTGRIYPIPPLARPAG
jgi:hypothetical protein